LLNWNGMFKEEVRMKHKLIAAFISLFGLGLAVTAAGPVLPVGAAPATKGFAYAWDNVIIDGQPYHIRASVTTTRDQGTTTTFTTCDYFNQMPVGTGWQQYPDYYVGRYQESGAQATNEAELRNFCVIHFNDRVL
jgi:hypothetical protein